MKYIEEYKEYLDMQLLELPGVKEGKMFGYPAYYVNGKLAICHYEDNLIVKLPTEKVSSLIKTDSNASREGPKPRKNMGKEWVFLRIPNIISLDKYIQLCFDSISFTFNKANES